MANKIIYAVTSGDYSEYHIVGIFDSREKAEEYINHSSITELNDIEEYNLNELKPDKSGKLFELRSGFDNIEFKVTGCMSNTMLYKDLMCFKASTSWGDEDQAVFFVRSKTRERAIKIASERLRQVKAEEHFRYLLLRRSIMAKKFNSRIDLYPFVHYHTGEVVLPSDCTLVSYTIPKDLEPHVKVITMEELAARYKKEK